MSMPALVKIGLGYLALKVISSGRKKSVFDASPALQVANSLPQPARDQALDLIELIDWWQTDQKGGARYALGVAMMPGYKFWPTKEALVDAILNSYFIPFTRDSFWNDPVILYGETEPLEDIVIDLIGHPINTSALTDEDLYDLLYAMNWPEFQPATGTVHQPSSVISPPGRPLNAEEKQKIDFVNWFAALVEKERQMSGNFGDMGFVRFSARYNSIGQKIHVTVNNGEHLHNPYTGDAVYRGTYADLVNWVGVAAWYQGFSTMPWPTIMTLIANYIKAMDAWGSLGSDGPTSTYASSIFASIDWSKLINWAIKAWEFIVKNINKNPDPETTDEVSPEILDISEIHP